MLQLVYIENCIFINYSCCCFISLNNNTPRACHNVSFKTIYTYFSNFFLSVSLASQFEAHDGQVLQ